MLYIYSICVYKVWAPCRQPASCGSPSPSQFASVVQMLSSLFQCLPVYTSPAVERPKPAKSKLGTTERPMRSSVRLERTSLKARRSASWCTPAFGAPLTVELSPIGCSDAFAANSDGAALTRALLWRCFCFRCRACSLASCRLASSCRLACACRLAAVRA